MLVMNNTSPETVDYFFNIVSACAWIITTILIFVLNIICLVILSTVTEFHSATKIFLKSMTASDLVLGIFFYFPMIAVSLESRTWPFGEAFCFIQAWIVRQALPTSTISLLLVTIDRYIAVVYPLRYTKWMTAGRAKLTVCVLWFLTNLYSFLSSFAVQWECNFNQALLVCQFYTENNMAAFLLTLFSLGSTVIIIIMYIRIFIIAHGQAVFIAAQHNLVTVNGVHQSTPQNRKSFTTIFIVTITLFIGWLPSVIMGLTRTNVKPQLRVASQILLASVSWLNVMIYYVRNRAFRKAGNNFVNKLWFRCCGQCDKNHHPDKLRGKKMSLTVESML